jgi:Zn-dependent peptidase ImmA (M78 family)
MRQGTPGFIGDRLKQAREARDLSAAALADLLGVTRASIYQYEGGLQSPSPEAMRRLSEVLNVPIQRFMIPMPNRMAGLRFYRCMAAATKRARVRAERKYEWVRDICDYVAQYIRLRDVKFPDVTVSRDPARISMEEVEHVAQNARAFFNLPDGPVDNVVGLLERHGAIVARYELEADTLDAFSEWEPTNQRPFVVLSSNKNSAARSRFDAAHELGHLVMHRNTPASYFCQADSFKLMERQAHRFASAFLMPESAFVGELYAPTLDAFRAAKMRWRVAISAMIMRASDLNLVDEERTRKLWINLGRRKWRTREPLDDSIEPERPRYLCRCIEGMLDRRMVSADDLSFQLGLPGQDIEQLAGLTPGRLSRVTLDSLEAEIDQSDDFAAVIRFPHAS